MRASILFTFLLAPAAPAEIIDRIAVTVGEQVITQSALLTEMRVAAFLDGRPPASGGEERRRAAERLVDLALIGREMELSRFPMPGLREIEPMLEGIREQRGLTEDAAYSNELRKYRLSDDDVRRHLLRQLGTLRFIDFRFRPGFDIPETEIQEYYDRQFLAQWKRDSKEAPPPLEEVRPKIEGILSDRRADRALERWLEQARTQVRVRFRNEVFQ